MFDTLESVSRSELAALKAGNAEYAALLETEFGRYFEANVGDADTLRLDNVLLTPHAGYYSDASAAQLLGRCGAEAASVLTGRAPLNLVNPEVMERLELRAE